MRIRLRRTPFLYGCSEALKTTRRKKGTALHDGVGSSMVFSSGSRASKDVNCQFSQHLNTQMVRFLFLQHCCIFVFFCISAGLPSRFLWNLWQNWQRNMPRKRKNFGREKMGSIGQTNDGDAHPLRRDRASTSTTTFNLSRQRSRLDSRQFPAWNTVSSSDQSKMFGRFRLLSRCEL